MNGWDWEVVWVESFIEFDRGWKGDHLSTFTDVRNAKIIVFLVLSSLTKRLGVYLDH